MPSAIYRSATLSYGGLRHLSLFQKRSLGHSLQPGTASQRSRPTRGRMGADQAQDPHASFHLRGHGYEHPYVREEAVPDSGPWLADVLLSDDPVGHHELDPVCRLARRGPGDLFFIQREIKQTAGTAKIIRTRGNKE